MADAPCHDQMAFRISILRSLLPPCPYGRISGGCREQDVCRLPVHLAVKSRRKQQRLVYDRERRARFQRLVQELIQSREWLGLDFSTPQQICQIRPCRSISSLQSCKEQPGSFCNQPPVPCYGRSAKGAAV